MSKQDFYLKPVASSEAKELLSLYHYLTKQEGKSFRAGLCYGLFNKRNGELVGVSVFTTVSAKETVKGMFGEHAPAVEPFVYELSRLCLHPADQVYEHNLASWFAARAIRELRKARDVKVLLSYADCDYHQGTVYQALGFTYYGKTAEKKDFYVRQPDGTLKKQNRGKTKGIQGKWLPRSQKHRYVKLFDKHLPDMLWEECPFPVSLWEECPPQNEDKQNEH